ncbi:MAG: hypothetical protein M1829_006686 [Trizodia sp. TS-e1964]|nr:MAG: hypothetical protein M1829_006686 [Trizodia sp. TS-e1964]
MRFLSLAPLLAIAVPILAAPTPASNTDDTSLTNSQKILRAAITRKFNIVRALGKNPYGSTADYLAAVLDIEAARYAVLDDKLVPLRRRVEIVNEIVEETLSLQSMLQEKWAGKSATAKPWAAEELEAKLVGYRHLRAQLCKGNPSLPECQDEEV